MRHLNLALKKKGEKKEKRKRVKELSVDLQGSESDSTLDTEGNPFKGRKDKLRSDSSPNNEWYQENRQRVLTQPKPYVIAFYK